MVSPLARVYNYQLKVTQSRLFAVGTGVYPGGGTYLIDEATATSAAYVISPNPAQPFGNYFGFFSGERYRAVVYASPNAPSALQLECESDTTCAAPTVIANAELPADSAAYLGNFANEIIWKVRNAADATLIDLKSCSLATWKTAACVPSTLASAVPAPESRIAFDNWATLYYVSGGKVIRVGL
jgi:hypothetical protein